MRIGIGYDVHKLVIKRKLVLGGVEIPHEKGLLGHSDADVLVHAICDALLGSLCLGDIGQHYPSNSKKYKNINSMILLKESYKLVLAKGYVIGNIDTTLILQQPKISSYALQMRTRIAEVLRIDIDQISIKATTSEGLGFEGHKEGISAQAICLILPK